MRLQIEFILQVFIMTCGWIYTKDGSSFCSLQKGQWKWLQSKQKKMIFMILIE